MGRNPVEDVYSNQGDIPFEIGKGNILLNGDDVAIIATGEVVRAAYDTGILLKERGIYARVIDMHTVKPIDEELIINSAKKTKFIITVEEHNIKGGLGSAVAEVLIQRCPLKQIDELYFRYYDAMYDIVKDEEGGSSYTVFAIWGPGKTAKVQCDFSAVMSPKQFQEFFVPSLAYKCSKLDYTLYHLDGPDAIKHPPAILSVKDLDAIQWTPVAGKPDGGSEDWYPIYDMVKKAGKSLWISIDEGNFDEISKKGR
ncbi:MAG: transketolase C-terminal domain-containing protein [bacterium]